MTNVLAFDLGGTSLRAALVDEAGVFLALRSTASSAGQSVEVDPETWWRSLAGLCEALAEAAPSAFAATGAIAISAFTRTQVLVGPAGEVVHPALLWHDSRAEAVVGELKAKCPAGHPEAARLNAFHPAARLLWLARTAPAALACTAKVVEPKDWLNFRLTGVLAGDTVSHARLAAAAAAGPDGHSILSAAGLSAALLPALNDPVSIMGRVVTGLPGALAKLAGMPVMAMANDTWASVAGLGALRPGYAYNISGTTEVLGLVVDRPAVAEGLLDVVWGPALHQLGGPGQNGADALVWALDLLGRNAGSVGAELSALLDQPRSPDPLLFLPYLQGERTPWWDASLRGALVGLNRQHKAADIAGAVMEGVAFLNRIVLERAEAGAGLRAGELRFGGGGAASAAWCQIKADILDRPVAVPAVDEPGLLGAALVAHAACGRFTTLAAAQVALVPPGLTYRPDPARRAHFDGLYAAFREAHEALRPVSHRLATWVRDRR
ncbi:MAG: carbohydrate kinase [Proteobacteria bacterium]|nr:carbohydrate kinase [Pseudomonadota bacterium]